jgi:hypothetical protein
MSNFTHTVLRAGQPRPYADHLFEAKVVGPVDATEEEVLAYCQTIRKALPKSAKNGENWHRAFYELVKLNHYQIPKGQYILPEQCISIG